MSSRFLIFDGAFTAAKVVDKNKNEIKKMIVFFITKVNSK